MVSLTAIEDLPHEDPLGVLALDGPQELLGVRVRCHDLFFVAVDQLDALVDQLRVFHPYVT